MNTNNEEREVTIPEILSGIIAYKNRVQNFKLLKDGIERKYVNDELDLEDRQQESVLKLIEDTEDGKYKDKGYFHACTAFGKTYLMMAIAESYRHKVKDKKIVIFEENATVLEQVKKDFIEKTSFLETDIGAYYGKEKTPEAPIIVCTYASMKKLIAEVGRENIGLALCDEAHHILSENRQEVAKYLDHSCLYGFTAPPEYDDVKSCAQVFGWVIDSVTLRQGINNGLLCGFKNGLIVSKIPVDLSEALDSSGDYNQEKLKEIFKQSHLHGMREELADFYLHGQDDVLGPIYGKTTMINVPSQEEANLLAEVFNQKAGKTIAKAYHTNSGDAPLEEFNQNKFPVLIQVNRLTEGYSNPNIEVCINYPTSSVVKSAQRSGRALRRNKNNPNKVALIMDIAFKKSNDLDTISAIKANKQVLFSDIAQEFMMLPRDVNIVPSQETGGNAKEKVEINENELFDIITDYENLFEFGFAEALHTESTAPQRTVVEKTDITKTSFLLNTIVKDEGGKSVETEIKDKIYDKVLEQRPDLFIKVQLANRTIYIVALEKREEFRKYLQETSFNIDGKTTIKIDNITFHDEKKSLKDTEITKDCFRKNAIVKDETGKSVERGIKPKIYDKVLEQRPDLFTRVQSGSNTIYVVPLEKREEFRKHLQETTFKIAGETIKIENITFHDEKEKAERNVVKDTDITKECFRKNAIVNDKTDKSVETGIKTKIYYKVLEQRPDLFTRVQSGSNTIYVVPLEKREEFRKHLQETTFKIDDETIKIDNITFHDEKKSLKDTDITKKRFKVNATVNDETGKSVEPGIKPKIYDKVLEQRPDLFIKVQSGPKTCYVVPEEKREEFRKHLQETTFEIAGETIKIDNITFHDEKKSLKDTDITKKRFKVNATVNDETGKSVEPGIKPKIYDKVLEQRPDLFTRVKSGPRTIYVVPLEKREKFRKYLQETSFDIEGKIIRIENIKFHDEKENKTKNTSSQIMPNNGGNEM